MTVTTETRSKPRAPDRAEARQAARASELMDAYT